MVLAPVQAEPGVETPVDTPGASDTDEDVSTHAEGVASLGADDASCLSVANEVEVVGAPAGVGEPI